MNRTGSFSQSAGNSNRIFKKMLKIDDPTAVALGISICSGRKEVVSVSVSDSVAAIPRASGPESIASIDGG
jgi:hypothetical protein